MLNNLIKVTVGIIIVNFAFLASAMAVPMVNHAVNGTATQSSTGYGGLASRAIDGNTSGYWGNGSVSHTNNDPAAWWEVDLGELININEIVIWNRTDCCAFRLNDFAVWLDGVVIDTNAGGLSDTTYVISNVNQVGQVVRIGFNDLTNTNQRYLQLAEVQVFGTDVPEPASLGLLGLGLVGFGLARRRRK